MKNQIVKVAVTALSVVAKELGKEIGKAAFKYGVKARKTYEKRRRAEDG